MSRSEFDSVRDYAQRRACGDAGTAPRTGSPQIRVDDDLSVDACRFLNTDTRRCAVYPVRPLVCRLMGLVEWMPCPTGRAADPVPTGVALKAIEEYCLEERADYETWLERVEFAMADGAPV